MSVIQVCLDPSFFWIAEHHDTPEAAEKYFERVVSMLVLHREKKLKFFMHEDSALELYQQGIVPSEKYLESRFIHLQEKLGFSLRDISKALNEILVNEATSENYWADAVLDLEEPVDVLSNQIIDSQKRDISASSMIHFAFTWAVSGNVSSYYFPRLQDDVSNTLFIIKVEVSAVDSPIILDGESLGVKVNLFSTATSLFREVDENTVWSAGADENALSLAVSIMAEKQFGIPFGDLRFSFGPEFCATANLCGGIDGGLKSILMNKIINILCAPDSVEISVFRKTKDANSGPRTRSSDNAVAHRVHLTKKHEAFRLMFWKDKDGHIEFANVGTKHEEQIL